MQFKFIYLPWPLQMPAPASISGAVRRTQRLTRREVAMKTPTLLIGAALMAMTSAAIAEQIK